MMQLAFLHQNLVPVMDWEQQLMSATGVSLDQARFSLAFFMACAAGILLRLVKHPAGERPGWVRGSAVNSYQHSCMLQWCRGRAATWFGGGTPPNAPTHAA